MNRKNILAVLNSIGDTITPYDAEAILQGYGFKECIISKGYITGSEKSLYQLHDMIPLMLIPFEILDKGKVSQSTRCLARESDIVAAQQKFNEAAKELFLSVSDDRNNRTFEVEKKRCGHDFFCSCASDKLSAAMKAFAEAAKGISL